MEFKASLFLTLQITHNPTVKSYQNTLTPSHKTNYLYIKFTV